MGIPTRKEYEEALDREKYLSNTLHMEHKRREKLIDELCASQKYIKDYELYLDNAKKVIQQYEIYQEILKENE